MTRAEFLRLCLGLAVIPMAASGSARAAVLFTEKAPSGCTQTSTDSSTSTSTSTGSDPWGGSSTSSSSTSTNCDSDNDGDDSGTETETECDYDHPSPENSTILLGVLGAAAAAWPHVREKISRLLK